MQSPSQSRTCCSRLTWGAQLPGQEHGSVEVQHLLRQAICVDQGTTAGVNQVGYAPLVKAQDADYEVVPSHRADTSQLLLNACTELQHDRL